MAGEGKAGSAGGDWDAGQQAALRQPDFPRWVKCIPTSAPTTTLSSLSYCCPPAHCPFNEFRVWTGW